MMLMRHFVLLGAASVVATLPLACSAESSAAVEHLMATTTNSWGRSIVDFQTAANSNMAVLARMKTTEATEGREAWLVHLMSLAVPTNTHAEYKVWLSEKASWLFGAGRSFGGPQNTNLWLSAAAAMGRIRHEMTTREELLARAHAECLRQERSAFDEGRIFIATSLPDWYFDESAHLMDQECAVEKMLSALIEHFAKRGMTRIPLQSRLDLYTNIVEKAILNESECRRLRDAIR